METALEESEFFEALEGADRGFARAIASAALRAVGRIDLALEGFLDRPLDKLDPAVLALLRCGCAQLWVLDAPSYAVVSATVESARRWKDASRGGGLINAILRRADRERSAFENTPVTAVWPDWLAEKLSSTLGQDRANMLAIQQLSEPRIDITVKSNAQDWADRLEAECLSSTTVRLPQGAPLTQLPGFADGEWWVQDAAAALPATLFGNVAEKHIADLCAAPGGKTMQLASMGAKVIALDLSQSRIARVSENLDRTKLAADTIVGDGRNWKPDEKLDAVLLDAPCSALGTLRRHPEGVWRRSVRSIEKYQSVQSELITAAKDMLKPGGVLVYSVCTPLPAEGRDHLALAQNDPDWGVLPITENELPPFFGNPDELGGVLTLPKNVESPEETPVVTDTFYIFRLVKK